MEDEIDDASNFNKMMFFGGLMICVKNGKSLADWIDDITPFLQNIDCGRISRQDIDSFCIGWDIQTDCIFILFDEYVKS